MGPVLSVLLSSVAGVNHKARQQPKTAAKPPAERAQCHRLVQHSGRVTRFSVAAADLLPSILWFGNIRGFVKLHFPTVNVCPHVAKNEPLSLHKAGISATAAHKGSWLAGLFSLCKLCLGCKLTPCLY